MNKELLAKFKHKKGIYRKWKQRWLAGLGIPRHCLACKDMSMEAKVHLWLNLRNDVKSRKIKFLRAQVAKGGVGEMWTCCCVGKWPW